MTFLLQPKLCFVTVVVTLLVLIFYRSNGGAI
jgi:hypothetical protein